MATRTSAVRLAVEGIEAYKAALKGAGDEGQKAMERLGLGAGAANQNVGKLGEGVNSFARIGRSNIFQNLGYQVNDFAVQVQGGTNKVVAFTQQFSQFVGGFGTVGAILGGVTGALGAAYSVFTKLGDASEYAKDKLGALTTGTKEYQAALEGIAPLQIAQLQYLRNLAAQQEKTAEANRKAQQQLPLAGLGAEGVGMGDLGVAPSRQQSLADLMRARSQNRDREFKQVDQLINDRELAQTKLLNIKGGGIGGITGASDYLAGADEIETYTEAQAKLTAQQEKDRAAKEASAKAAETLRVANAKLLEQAKLSVQAAQDEFDALTMGEDARKRANVEREYELKLLEAAQPAHKANQLALIDEANALRDVKLATIERARAIDDAQAKIDASPDAAGGGGLGFHGETEEEAKRKRAQLNSEFEAEAKRLANKQEDIMLQPWLDLASEVSRVTTNMFDDILTKGKVTFKDLATGIEDTFRTTITGTLGTLAAMPLNSMVQKIQEGNYKDMMPNWGGAAGSAGAADYTTAVAGGAAGGYAVGATYGQLTGKQDTYAATGGAVGGAAGAAIGTVIAPGWGTIVGGALGSMAGSFIGGMFGGEGLGNDQSVQKFGSKVAKAIWSDKSFSEENRQVTGGIIGQLGQLSEALRATGANIKDVTIGISAGNKTGIQVQGKGFGTDADAAAAAAIRLLLQNTSGLQGSQVTAIKTTKGRNVQEVMDDLAFAREFDKITFSGTAAEAAMRDLKEQFDATGRRARALGLDEIALASTRERAMAQLTAAAARQARDLGAQFQMAIATSDLDRGIIGVNQQFAGLNDSLTDAGYSAENLAKLEAARVAAEGQVRAQAAAQAQAEADARAQQAAAAAQQRQAEAQARRQQAIQEAEQRKQAQRQARSLLAQYQQTITQSDLERTIIGINESFAQLRDTMKDAGYNAKGFANVEAARQRAVRDAIEQDQRQRRDILAQYQQTITTSDLERTIIGINQQFRQLADTMKEAGYNAAGFRNLEAARDRAIKEAQEQQRRQQRDLYSQYLEVTRTSTLEKSLLQVNTQFDQLIDTFKDAGYSAASLAEVEKARTRAQAEAIEQMRQQAVSLSSDLENKIRGIGSFYDDLIRPLQAINQNNLLNPQGQIGAARQAFQADLSGAGARDPDAIRRLAGSAQQYQQLVSQNYGTGGVGAQYLREIQGGLGGTIAGLQQERAAALADLPQIVQRTTMDIIRENRADIDRVVAELEGLRTDLRTRGVKFA